METRAVRAAGGDAHRESSAAGPRRVALPVRPLLALSVLCALLASACQELPPVVREQRYARVQHALVEVAVLPFATSGDQVSREAADSVSGLVAESLRTRGVNIVQPAEVRELLVAESPETQPPDLQAALDVADQKLHSSALLTGRVVRYRERAGSQRMASQPASVAFEMTLYSVPERRPLWRGRFDQTQGELSDRPRERARLPGGGLRWLTAEELAQWGAQEMVNAMLSAR